MIRKLHAILDEIAARRQRQRFHLGLAIAWWAALVLGLALWKSGLPPRAFVPWLLVGLAAAVVAVRLWSRSGRGDPRRLAREIERRHPSLQTALLAALDQAPADNAVPLSYLQSRVIVESLAAAQRDEWLEMAPRPRLTAFRALHLGGAVFFTIALIVMMLPRRAAEAAPTAAAPQPPAAAEPLPMNVDPGDVEIERGSPLTVQVTFDKQLPDEATLELTGPSGVSEIPLTRPFSDPVFQARIESVGAETTYRVKIPAGASRSYTIRVFDRPALVESEVVLHFPAPLGKPPQTIKDPHNFQVPEGTRMELSLVANVPGLAATLVAAKREPQPVPADPADPRRHRFAETLIRSVRYEIVLTDSAGRRNHRKDTLDIKVIPNKPPQVQVLLPRKNDKATPIQELRVEARITDDSALISHGLRYTVDGEKWEDIPGAAPAGGREAVISHLIDLETAGAKPNDLVMWNAWAEDIGPDGRNRRVDGDLHIVAVRDFDQEFQQSPPMEGGGAPPQSGDNLVKLQTKILNGTWAVRRDHADPAGPPPVSEELETLRKSQEIAIGMAADMESQETNPTLREFITDARLAMKDAAGELAKAREQSSVKPLDPAIGHEQAALRHLNRLMTSKTMVSRSQGQSGSPSEEDNAVKEDLELKPMDNPYRSEQAAAPELAQQASEAMAVLKQLDELAKRQRDINEEIKALQMAANEATSPAEKAALERQLKQLREQQREMLADLDRVREKTAETAPDQKEELDQARENTRRIQEELDKEQLGDALASGHRAQEGLEKVRDEFRETSAAKLGQQLSNLRQQARELEQRQRQLSNPDNPGRNPAETADSEPEPSRQQEDFRKLVDDLRQTAETAERAEPLVAKDLGEALRQADQAGIAKNLEEMEQSGAASPSAAGRAADGISKLTREIESAAERILGNEAQALRFARDELERLAGQAAGQQPGEGQEPREGQQPGQNPGQSPSEGQSPGQGQGQGQTAGRNPGGQRGGDSPQRNAARQGPNRGGAISGGSYEEWRDRLSDLEAVVTSADAQAAIARARRAGQEMRKDFKRHSRVPDQEKIDQEVLKPLAEAARELDARLKEIERKDPLAPVGRDPVPDRYTEIVRRYFEELGK